MKNSHILTCILFIAIVSCKKEFAQQTFNDDMIASSSDESTDASIGFFMNKWKPKTFVTPRFKDTTIHVDANINVTVNPAAVITSISPLIFGNNANTYMTQMVDQPTLITNLTNLEPGIIRFPGGSLSGLYFFNGQPYTPPADAPSTLTNADGSTYTPYYWYGKNTESWTISLDNYYNMLQQTGSTGIITVNYDYARYGTGNNPVAAAAHLAADWVRYDNGRTQYWEVGNENFGNWQPSYRINLSNNKDGQPEFITGNLYGQHFKVFADSMRKAARQIGKTIHIGAVLFDHDPESWQDATTKGWNTGVLSVAGTKADYYIVHNYYTPYDQNSNAADILNTAAPVTRTMKNYITQIVKNAGIAQKPLALTEWNIFAIGSKQQVSNVAGMHAVMVLGEVLKNKFGEASRWDLANAYANGDDHGLFNNGDEPNVPKWNPRPAFYHMYFFKKMLGDKLVRSNSSDTNSVVSYASSYTSGQANVTLVNKSTSAQTVKVKFNNFTVGNRYYWYTLVGGSDNGEFSSSVYVNGHGPTNATGGPTDYATIASNSASTTNGITVSMPARSVVCMVVDKK